MAKWVLYILILINLVAFLWLYSRTPTQTPQLTETNPVLLNSDRIKLVKPGEIQGSTETVQNNLTEVAVVEADPDKAPETDIPIPSSTNSESQPLVEEKIQTDNSESADPLLALTNNQNPEVKTTQKQQDTIKQPSQSDEEKQLIAEMQAFSEDSVTPEPQQLIEQTTISTPSRTSIKMLCYQYGPLSGSQAEAIGGIMNQQQIPMIEQSRILVEKRGYLVLIKPQADAAAARKQMRVARKAGLDAFTITKGDWIHGVSLGIFSAKANADTLFNRATKLLPKSAVQIKERVRETEVFRLIFKLQKDRDPEKLLASSPFPTFDSKDPLQITTKVAKKSCETVEF